MRWKRGKTQAGDPSDYYVESTNPDGYRVAVNWCAGVKWYIAWAPQKNKDRERLGQQLNEKAAKDLCSYHAKVSTEENAHYWANKIKQDIDAK